MKMKKVICIMLCGIMTMGLFMGCKSSDTEKTNTISTTEENNTSTDVTTVNAEPVTIKIWHDGDETIMKMIEEDVNNTLSKDQITVSFEKKTGLTDQLKLYGNDQTNGPDMYFYAHDSIGTFVEMGIAAPLKDIMETDLEADFLPMTVEAGTYQDEQYFLPVYFETLLFLYNKNLWEGEIPATTEDLYQYMAEHTDTKAGTYAVVNQHSTAYNAAPFINGFGGYIINEEGIPGLNNQETKDAIVYNQKFAALQADGDYNTVTTLFNEEKAQAIIGGPWLVSGIKEAGIEFGVKSLSSFTLPDGNPLAPYSGVQGVGVLKSAVETKKAAIQKVVTALSTEELGVRLAKEFNCAPANEKAYDDPEVAANEMIAAMKETALTAIPMPNVPQMSVMWGPAEALLAAVNKSGADVNSSAVQYQKEAETAINDME